MAKSVKAKLIGDLDVKGLILSHLSPASDAMHTLNATMNAAYTDISHRC